MDYYFPSSSPEAVAHSHFIENGFDWDTTHQHLDEAFVSSCAAYQAFSRYISGADLYIPPRNRPELERILKRYTYDAIHNTIAKARAQVLPGGYSRMCERAEISIKNVLNKTNNDHNLVVLHSRFLANHDAHALSPPSPRFIRTT
ncbi:hypothetical protein BDV98DRAFT_561022 [Pterulicium gracile]|uniref:Uncharacterized protein n=1 Tax=Pterulicium gracile TaxID=1884261 RepID=A0A5C3QVG9_9AGAR|nr:hypothetical protein BDV98DRAFT_561022 [Pterula gracilis]